MYQTFELFDLRVFRGQGGVYPVEVLRSPAGEAAGEFSLPFSPAEIQQLLQQLEFGQIDRQTLKDIGERMYGMLFVPAVERRYRESLAGLKPEQGLRLRLRVDAPELTPLPWEFLFDPQANEFLSLSPRAPLVRYVAAGAVEPLQVQAPVRLLLAISSPSDAAPLDTTREVSLVQQALADQVRQGKYAIDVLEHPTLHSLADKLREGYHILHYIGHAFLDPDTGAGALVLEDDAGASRPVDADALGPMLKDTSLRLMLLNACESGRSGGRDAGLGLAPELVSGGMPAVVAMQFTVPDRTAVLLAREFYSAISDNAPVDAAISEARKVIRAELGADTFDWGIPVVFMRSPDGHILEVKPPPKPKAEAMLSRRGWVVAGILALLLLGLLGLIGVSLASQAGILPDAPTPTPTLEVPAAGADEFLVVVAEFPGRAGQEDIVGGRLRDQIEAQLQGSARVESVLAAPRSETEAQELGRRYDASIVVWGEYDNEGLFSHLSFVPSRYLQASGVEEAEAPVRLEEVALQARMSETVAQVVPQVNYLALYMAGQVHAWRAYNLQLKGQADAAAQEVGAAMSLYDQALQQIADRPESEQAGLNVDKVHTVRGIAAYNLGEFDRARQDFERAIELNPRSAKAHLELGRTSLFGLGNAAGALAQLQQALDVARPDQAEAVSDALAMMGYIYANYDPKDLERAADSLRQALERSADNVFALSTLGDLKYAQGQYAEAIQLYQRAVEANPEERDPVNEMVQNANVGLASFAGGDAAAGEKAFQRAVAVAAAHPSATMDFYLSAFQGALQTVQQAQPDLSAAIEAVIAQLEAAKQGP